MPRSARSLQLTDAYRTKLFAIRGQLQDEATRRFPTIQELDATDFDTRMAGMVRQGQNTALRLTGGYLTAFTASEIGKRGPAVVIDTKAYSGMGADGSPLAESLRSPLIGTLAALKVMYRAPAPEVLVTPEMARDWLRGGTHGNLDPGRVAELAAKMRAGSWDPSQGAIRITKAGFVFAGQHRLNAIVEYGEPVRMKVSESLDDPIGVGLERARRQVGMDFDACHRAALLQAIETDDRFGGWQRALRGTCGACAGIATGPSGGLLFEVHPGCQCVAEPVVRSEAPPVRVLDRAGTPAPGMAEYMSAIHGSARATYGTFARRALDDALDLIKQTHKWPEGATPIPIRPVDAIGAGVRGEFVTRGTAAREIRIYEMLSDKDIGQTLTHEMGHYLDASLSGEGVAFLSEGYPSPAMEHFLEVARTSQAMQTVMEYARPAELEYLNRPRELWARAYAQWMTGSSRTGMPGSWDGPDFRAVGKAVHAVLKEQGLL